MGRNWNRKPRNLFIKTVLKNILVKCIEVYATSCDLIDCPWDVIQVILIQTYTDINKVKMEYSRLIDRLNFTLRDWIVFCNNWELSNQADRFVSICNFTHRKI